MMSPASSNFGPALWLRKTGSCQPSMFKSESYTARNKARAAITGVALYNVTPEKAAKYFHKTACFCFNQQTLEGGQTMDFPLSFWVDPAIETDPGARDVKVVTLSYTFFRSLDDAEKTGALAKAGPHVGAATN